MKSLTGTARPDGSDASVLAAIGVEYCVASYVDMHGVSKTKMTPITHHAQMMAGSEMFTGAALDGVPQAVSDDEVCSMPDPASCNILPWEPTIAWYASDLHYQGAPFEACSRTILKRQLARAAALGYKFNFGIEAEFFVLKDTPDGGYAPLSDRQHLAKPAYDLSRLLDNFAWIKELVAAMDQLGFDVYSFDHEDGIGQFEIDFNYADGLTMADRYVFFRMMANEIARKHGGFASFMPKPYADRAGSGAHFNMSLADLKTGENLFKDKNDPKGCGLSQLGYHFIAGVLKHLPAICAMVAPSVNSYKRLIKQGSASGFTWAPVLCCYGNNNRTNALRIPMGGGRVELRAADSSCNPYLAAAMVLSAGLEGVEQKLDPGAPNYENMYLKGPEDLAALGIQSLPGSLDEALNAFATDSMSSVVLGPSMYKAWLDYKRDEWNSFSHHVSNWERERYLKFF
ncbi:MAG: type III glutamate--ammonia ligase [Acidocella sp. 20-57-95]|nr:MAG: type III glutamate--ammonia ligase [Acidocella sp. 20-57-95]OYV60522.1 MAG: type III glutamate--ammonia ligase [Acidocella sp. 21-58-7]HQT62879.1 type III glutamate--ammonia ligase [Acidocella sp.]HQU03916.1 type III glutamate--ammonia ligase [Acidocella sp.]